HFRIDRKKILAWFEHQRRDRNARLLDPPGRNNALSGRPRVRDDFVGFKGVVALRIIDGTIYPWIPMKFAAAKAAGKETCPSDPTDQSSGAVIDGERRTV